MIDTIVNIRPKLAFAGVGWIGRHRMKAAAESGLADIIGVSDTSDESIKEAQKIVNTPRQYRTFEETIADPELDAVVISTPSALHMQQSVLALHHGKSVFCQKPLGRTAQEVQQVIEAAKKANKLLGVDLSYRHLRAFRKLHSVIRSGELGKIFAAELKFHNAYGPDKPWYYDVKQSGGGCVLDLGIHLIDLLLYVLDFPKVRNLSGRLYAKGSALTNRDEVEDYADVTMTLENDVQANLSCSWNLQAGREAVIEASFYGTGGGVAMKNINGSFYDFSTYRYQGTKTEVLVNPPDAWGGRAITDWLKTLSASNSFQRDSNHYMHSAQVIDRIYGLDRTS